MPSTTELLDWTLRLTALAVAPLSVYFALKLKRHNRKNAHLEDLRHWAPIATLVLRTHLSRAVETDDFELDDAAFRRPPRVPGMRVPYYAISWLDFRDDQSDVQTEPFAAANQIEALFEALPALGLGHLTVSREAFLEHVLLLSPDTDVLPEHTPHVVLASTIYDPATFEHFAVAVLLHEHGIVWAHRIDKRHP